MYFKENRIVAPEMFGLAYTVGVHISSYAHDTRLYPTYSYCFSLFENKMESF